MLIRVLITTFIIFIFVVCNNGLPPQKQHKDRRWLNPRHDVTKRDAAMTRAQKMAKVSRLRELRREVEQNQRFESFVPAASIAGLRRRYAHYEPSLTAQLVEQTNTSSNSSDSSNTMSESLESHFRPLDQEVPQDHLVPFQEFGKKLVASRAKSSNTLEIATLRPADVEKRKSSDKVDEERVEEMDVAYNKPYTETNKATRPHHIMVIRQGNRRIHIANNKTATLHIENDELRNATRVESNSTELQDNVADETVHNVTVTLSPESIPNQKPSISEDIDRIGRVYLKEDTSTEKPIMKSNRSSTGFTLLHRTRGQIYGAKKNMTLAKLAREGFDIGNNTVEAMAWGLEAPVKNLSRTKDQQADNTIVKHSRGNATYKSSLYNARRIPKTMKPQLEVERFKTDEFPTRLESMREASTEKTTTTLVDFQNPTSKILSTAVVTSISVLGDWTPTAVDGGGNSSTTEIVHITPRARVRETIEVTFSRSSPAVKVEAVDDVVLQNGKRELKEENRTVETNQSLPVGEMLVPVAHTPVPTTLVTFPTVTSPTTPTTEVTSQTTVATTTTTDVTSPTTVTTPPTTKLTSPATEATQSTTKVTLPTTVVTQSTTRTTSPTTVVTQSTTRTTTPTTVVTRTTTEVTSTTTVATPPPTLLTSPRTSTTSKHDEILDEVKLNIRDGITTPPTVPAKTELQLLSTTAPEQQVPTSTSLPYAPRHSHYYTATVPHTRSHVTTANTVMEDVTTADEAMLHPVTEPTSHPVEEFDERILHPVFENKTEEVVDETYLHPVDEVTSQPPSRTSLDHVRGEPPTRRPPKVDGDDKNHVVYRGDEVQKTEEDVDNDVATYILGTFGLIPVAIAVLLAAKYCISRRKKIWESEKSPLTFVSTNEWEFPRSKLRLQTVLGQGNFGLVYKAEADDILGERATRLVAVKTIKDGASSREKEDLMRELVILKQIGAHSNVVTLFGCCTDKEPYLLIMEYVMYGKLLSFLRDNRTRKQYYNFSEETAELTAKDLTSFAYCVARGMEYLTSKGIIHRDLAARNILVDHNKICKVADFGMSRSVTEPDQIYEQAPAKGALPIRWMAPESLTYRVFTHKSDVWAFGILMWEIVTLGSTPYQTMSGREVIRQVRDGYRLERPTHCRPELYRVAATCWHHDASKRPSFSDVKAELALLLEQGEQQTYVDLDSYIESISNSRTQHTTQVVSL